MTDLLDARPAAPARQPASRAARTRIPDRGPGPLATPLPLRHPDTADGPITVYGDFNCPWSYLAHRRAVVLADAGVTVDWRAVEHDPRRPRRFPVGPDRFDAVRAEMDLVLAELLPGERLPYSLAGFLPYTRPAVSAYAEARGAGVAAPARDLLFEAFWMHGVDLGQAELVRTLLVDAIRSGSSRSELLREWGYAVDATGAPLTTDAWRLVRQWTDGWRDVGEQTVPVVVPPGGAPVIGVEAVRWLGAELVRRGLEPWRAPRPRSGAAPTQERRVSSERDLASRSWVSEHGNRWMRAYQRAHRPPLFPEVG